MAVNDVYLQLRNAWSQSLPANPDQLFCTLAEVLVGDAPGGLGTMATQNADAVAVTGGTLNNVAIGDTTAATVVNALRMSNSPTGLQTTLALDPAGEQDTVETAAYSGRVKRTGKISTAPTGFSSVTGAWRFAYEDATSAASVQQSAVAAIMLATGNAASVTNNEEQSQRNALQAKIAITGVYGSVSAPDPYIAFCGLQSETSISSDQGGTGGWTPAVSPAAPYLRGSAFGLNSLSIMRNGATNWVENMAMEITISNQTGSSAGRKIGLHISKKGDDAVAALTGDESAISIASFGAVPWVEGLSFGWKSGSGNWPFDATSTLIGITPQVWPVARDRSFRPANIGLDLREATYTTAAIMWPGGYVNPSGNLVWTIPSTTPATLTTNNEFTIYAVDANNVRLVARLGGVTKQSANIPVS